MVEMGKQRCGNQSSLKLSKSLLTGSVELEGLIFSSEVIFGNSSIVPNEVLVEIAET